MNIFDFLLPLAYFDDNSAASYFEKHKPHFEKLVKQNCKVVVEIGSFLGKSTIGIAKMLPDDGVVIAVDPFEYVDPNPVRNSRCIENYKRRQKKGTVPDLYAQFLSNCARSGVGKKIIPIKMTSETASRVLKVSPDLIYFDGDHSYQGTYRALKDWFPKCREDTVICGDDWHYRHRLELGVTWNKSEPLDLKYEIIKHEPELEKHEKGYSVRRAVKRFAKENGFIIWSYGKFWWLEKKK